MQANKVIFKGRFDFGSKEVVLRIVKQLEPRIINLYKEDFPWKIEDLFPEDAEHVIFKPISLQVMDRTWKHGLDALNWLAQFALCGEVLAIRLGAHRVTERIVPVSDKAAVLLYRHAMEDTDLVGRADLLDQVIAKYPVHVEALMARADLAIDREDLVSALTDLNLIQDRDPENPAFWHRISRCNFLQGDWDQALSDIENAIAFSMPLEDIHWQSRMLKARILKSMEQFEQALHQWNLLETKLEKTPELLPGLLQEVRKYQKACLARLEGEESPDALSFSPERGENIAV
ncbi:MAG: hypothetical protein KA479_10865 [Saprospiraceae bacterium]|nr:hypothetical protein [Saprospiraceae bacterium]